MFGSAIAAPYHGVGHGTVPAPAAGIHQIDHLRLPGSGDLENLAFTIEPRDARMTVVRAANVRSGPATEFDKVSELEPGSEVSVTGATSIAGEQRVDLVSDGEQPLAGQLGRNREWRWHCIPFT
jgi:hypothetical protein